jgi:hypothetical protein
VNRATACACLPQHFHASTSGISSVRS